MNWKEFIQTEEHTEEEWVHARLMVQSFDTCAVAELGLPWCSLHEALGSNRQDKAQKGRALGMRFSAAIELRNLGTARAIYSDMEELRDALRTD